MITKKELRKLKTLEARFEVAKEMLENKELYFSPEWVLKNILNIVPKNK